MPTSTSTTMTSNSGSSSTSFSIQSSYFSYLRSSIDTPSPIAAILALCDLITSSQTSTTSELISLIRTASNELKNSLPNPVPASAGIDLFTRFVLTKNWDTGLDFDYRNQEEMERNFEIGKNSLVETAREYCKFTVPSCRERITGLVAPFIKDDAVILTHSYSRVVMQILVSLAQTKRISVYVTESRPGGLGLKTHSELLKAGIPSTLVLDSAVAYTIPRCDLVLVGAEGVAESGGIINAVGTYQIALISKALGKPFYCAAESFKFLRIFPLSQDDLPTSTNRSILPFPSLSSTPSDLTSSTKDSTPPSTTTISNPQTPTLSNEDPKEKKTDHDRSKLIMSSENESQNPLIDYTLPELLTFIFSDCGVLTPSGVSDALLTVYNDNN